ncbi:unnamed protein product [Cylindrotheca closterium]|uniref:Calmodulin n=1 Tax=Cylindrotheca closterium TaxID=2856 RepID=A0AAD2CQ73_9STRA|nr:unnamed protein product [Cylindrotheca closterium]
MMSNRGSKSNSLVAWKAVVLGGVCGYLLATLTQSFDGGLTNGSQRRWLAEEPSEGLHQGEGSEEGEEVIDPTTMDATIALIVLLLVILTIAFETIKEYIEEAADHNMRPIIASLFGEMTVLGFLSVFTFCVTKLGFFEEISIHLFEEDEALLEIFEFVHFMLFFIMVFFVTSVLALVAGAQRTEDKWFIFDMACRDPEYMKRLEGWDSKDTDVTQAGWFIYFLKTLFPFTASKTEGFRKELRLFRGLRTEFLLQRSPEPPFEPKPNNRVHEDFGMGQYFSACLGHDLAHAVHLNHITWFFFALLTLVFYIIIVIVDNQFAIFAWFWVGAGWTVFIVRNIFDYHIQGVLQGLASPSSSNGIASESENASLLSLPLPAWAHFSLDEYNNGQSLFVKFLGIRGLRGKVTRQDALYWFGRSGPKLYSVVFQIQLVFTSAYVSLLIVSFFKIMYTQCSSAEWTAYLILSLLPLYYLISKNQDIAANMTIVSNFGVHRRPQVVSQVIRDEKIDRIIRAMAVIFKLQRAIEQGFDGAAGTSHGHHNPNGKANSSELQEVAKAFDALDPSSDGKIDSSELSKILGKLGLPVSDKITNEILQVLDENGDGVIVREEFLAFYSQHVSTSMDHHGIHELAHQMYHQFDRDNSGQITLEEFQRMLEAFNVGFTVNEIGDLVNELDEQNDGTVGEHEFAELFESRDYLFVPRSLPSLE